MPYRLLMETAFDKEELRWLSNQKVAYLATTDVHAQPHLVPVVFVLVGQEIFISIDEKPKKHKMLKRLSNIRENPKVSLIADHYDDDWQQLRWVRIDGIATILAGAPQDSTDLFKSAVSQLKSKYWQYEQMDLSGGPIIKITLVGINSWQAKG